MTDPDLLGRLKSIDGRLARLEGGFFGDEDLGHKGFNARLERVEGLVASAPEVHAQMRQDVKAGDARIHERVDGLVAEWSRTKFLVIGAVLGSSAVGGSLGAWLFRAVGG